MLRKSVSFSSLYLCRFRIIYESQFLKPVQKFHGTQNSFYRSVLGNTPAFVLTAFPTKSVRFKTSQSKSGRSDVLSDDESSDEEVEETGSENYDLEPGSKIKTYLLTSIRVDSILKHGLNLRGRASEKIILSSRAKLNGNIINKKSIDVHIDDKLEVTTDYSADGDPKVTRIGILDIVPIPQNQKIRVTLSVKKL